MATSADLGLPYIASSQAQPEVTHNDALNLIQALLNGVISVGLNTPAVGPTIGDSYVIGTAPTGAWAGRANVVTIWNGTAWDFIPGETSAGTPITMGARQEGLRVWNKATNELYIWSGSSWGALASGASQAGIASALASGDLYLQTFLSCAWGSATVPTTVTRFQMFYVDSDITVTGASLNVSTLQAGSTVSVDLYEFLGAGNPGTSLGTASIDTTATGIRTASFAAPVALTPGPYFLVYRATVATPTIQNLTASTEAPATDLMLLLTDGLSQIAGTGERVSLQVDDADLPGGSWSAGMDLTSLSLSSANTTLQTIYSLIALVKQ